MLTPKELEEIEQYLEKKPALTSKNLLKYIRNNYAESAATTPPPKTPKRNAAAEAAAPVRRADRYIWNPNPPGQEVSSDAKRGVHVRTQGDSERGDETRKYGKRS